MKHLLFIFFLAVGSCQKPANDPAAVPVPEATPQFAVHTVSPVAAGVVDEASGIADSYTQKDALWVQQDGGNAADLALIGYNGTLIKKIKLEGITNRDWEDMAVAAGPQPAKNYIYIGEIGDNNAAYASCAFYRFLEPTVTTDAVSEIETIRFTYNDGPRDAEAFFIDGQTKDIYIITKRETQSRLYKLAYPQSTTNNNTAQFIATLPFNTVVSAAIANNGQELLVKTYDKLLYWKTGASKSFAELLQTTPLQLPYTMEPQGEAVCFANNAKDYFTLSEKSFAPAQALYYYKRK